MSLIMAVEKQKQKRVERWRNKFRLVILNDDTFEELLTLRLSPLNVFTFSVFAIVFTIATTSLVIAFTPLKELVPGYASSKIRRQAVELSLKTDSLEGVLRQNERYVSGVQRILRGEVIDSVVQDVLSEDTAAGTDIVLSNPKRAFFKRLIDAITWGIVPLLFFTKCCLVSLSCCLSARSIAE